MKHEFEVSALPVFLEVLALCDRAATGTAGPVETEHAKLKAGFDGSSAKMLGSSAAEWGLAHYALVALADELLIVDVPWQGQAWWENHALEVNLQGTRARSTEFYKSADRAVSLPPSDVMGIYVAAVVMTALAVFLRGERGVVLLWWEPGRALLILLLLIAIPLCIYKGIEYWLSPSVAIWPDINTTWRDALQELSRQQIDILDTPLFLLLGTDGRDLEQAVLRDAPLRFTVVAAPPGSAPMHVYGSKEGLIVCLSDIGQTALLGSKIRATAAPGGSEGALPTGSGNRGLISAAERKPGQDRLTHFCRLLMATRRTIAPINGTVVLLPVPLATASSIDYAAAGDVVGEDLLLMQKVFGLRAPVVFFIDVPAGAESLDPLVARLTPDQRVAAIGQPFPPGLKPTAEEMNRACNRAADALHDVGAQLLLNRSLQAVSDKDIAINRQILVALFRSRLYGVSRAAEAIIAATGLVGRNAEDLLLAGIYLVSSHVVVGRQAFLRGAFQRMLDLQDNLVWTRNTQRKDKLRRRVADGLLVVDGLIVVALIVVLWMRFKPV